MFRCSARCYWAATDKVCSPRTTGSPDQPPTLRSRSIHLARSLLASSAGCSSPISASRRRSRNRSERNNGDWRPAPRRPSGRGAKGTKAGSAASPFPCRDGKLREKFFLGLALPRKFVCYHGLARDLPVKTKTRQGNGREARKCSDRRLASTGQCYHINY